MEGGWIWISISICLTGSFSEGRKGENSLFHRSRISGNSISGSVPLSFSMSPQKSIDSYLRFCYDETNHQNIFATQTRISFSPRGADHRHVFVFFSFFLRMHKRQMHGMQCNAMGMVMELYEYLILFFLFPLSRTPDTYVPI